jgi:malonyl-CoA O-methyltransferase
MENRVLNMSVSEAYDHWSEDYDGYNNPMLQCLASTLETFPYDLNGKSVFEFGCGTGRNLAWAQSQGAVTLAGCDLSSGMLKQAKERLPQANLIHGDMSEPIAGLAPQSVDHVFYCLTLEHVSQLQPALNQGRDMLKTGGRITIAEIHPFFAWNGSKAHFKKDGDEIHMPTYTHRFCDYLNAFAALNLKVEHCREVTAGDVTDDPQAKILKHGPNQLYLAMFHLKL